MIDGILRKNEVDLKNMEKSRLRRSYLGIDVDLLKDKIQWKKSIYIGKNK